MNILELPIRRSCIFSIDYRYPFCCDKKHLNFQLYEIIGPQWSTNLMLLWYPHFFRSALCCIPRRRMGSSSSWRSYALRAAHAITSLSWTHLACYFGQEGGIQVCFHNWNSVHKRYIFMATAHWYYSYVTGSCLMASTLLPYLNLRRRR